MPDRSTEEEAPGLALHRWFESLVSRDFRLLLGSNFLNHLSIGMELVVLGWLILDITNSVWYVTLGAFLHFAPVLPVSILAGTLADRLDRKKLLLFNQIGNIVTVGAMVLLLIFGSIELWQIYAVAPLRGLFHAVQQPARRALVIDLVGRERITNAIALDGSIMMLCHVLGPFISGFLIDTWGPGSSYIAILTFYATGTALLGIIKVIGSASSPRSESIVKDMAEGLRYSITHPVILPALALTLIQNLLGFPFRQVFPVFAKDIYRVNATGLGLMGSSIGVGAFLGSLALAALSTRFPKGKVYIWGSMLMAITTTLFSLSRSFYPSMAILFVHGFGFAGFHVMQASIPLSVSDEGKRGRVMGVLQLAIGGGPLGILMVGALASALGVQMAVGFMAGVLTLIIIAIAMSAPQLRRT
ncbi:MFS transporter [Dehalococcoidia bacterium]|nr:MFS transporter [Dehalococcoidia bacterium]